MSNFRRQFVISVFRQDNKFRILQLFDEFAPYSSENKLTTLTTAYNRMLPVILLEPGVEQC